MSKATNKCTCGAGQKLYCVKCSRIKMAIMLKNGNDYLKFQSSTGKLNNPVWYSHLSKNSNNNQAVIVAMIRRFVENQTKIPPTAVNCLIFYTNGSSHQLDRIELS